jgi:hypothetical protein
VEGLAPAELGVDLVDDLLAPLPAGSSVERRRVQLTHRAMPADYAHAVRVLLGADAVDALVVIFAPPLPDLNALPAHALLELEPELTKPLVTVIVGLDDGPLAKGSRIPVFAFPEPAVGALGRIARHVTSQDRMPLGEPRRPDGIDVEAAEAIIEQALQARPEGTMLPLRAAEGLLRAYGVSVSAGRAVTSEDAAVDAANEELGYPVALKANGIVRRDGRSGPGWRSTSTARRRSAGVAGDHGGARRRGDGRGCPGDGTDGKRPSCASPWSRTPSSALCSPSAWAGSWPTPSTIASPASCRSAPATRRRSSRPRAPVARWMATPG